MPSKLNPGPFDCMAAALPDEEYMVFLARDPLAPWILAIWASARVGNFAVAMKNFELMWSGGLLEHYKKHPDEAKSVEAIAIAERMRAWREANLLPGLQPTWKLHPTERSKQRPPLRLCNPEAEKIACGLRQIASDMFALGQPDMTDCINGFASELDCIAGKPLPEYDA